MRINLQFPPVQVSAVTEGDVTALTDMFVDGQHDLLYSCSAYGSAHLRILLSCNEYTFLLYFTYIPHKHRDTSSTKWRDYRKVYVGDTQHTAAILKGIHISLVTWVREYTKHRDTDITVTGTNELNLVPGENIVKTRFQTVNVLLIRREGRVKHDYERIKQLLCKRPPHNHLQAIYRSAKFVRRYLII